MRAALALVVLAVVGAAEARDRTCRWNRTARSLECGESLPFFSFAPASGAGMTDACACTSPTGAKGEALTFTRTGNATCSKGGLATTGIADGDLVVCSGNAPRVERDADGVRGLRVEGARTNVLIQSGDVSNAAYADVGTPGLTGSQADPFGATTAVLVEDNDGAAYEGRSQSVTVTAATAYMLSCYLKAGTSALARLSLDGTACNVSGLSASSWTRATCADASSSGTSIAVQLLVGNAVGDTGTVIYGGCQVEAGAYATSYIPTAGSATTRNAEAASFTGLVAASNVGGSSWAGSIQFPVGWAAAPFDGPFAPYANTTNRGQLYYQTSNAVTCSHISTGASINSGTLGAGVPSGVERLACAQGAIGSGTLTAFRNGTPNTPVSMGAATAFSATEIRRIGGGGVTDAAVGSSIVSRLCYQPDDPSRCR